MAVALERQGVALGPWVAPELVAFAVILLERAQRGCAKRLGLIRTVWAIRALVAKPLKGQAGPAAMAAPTGVIPADASQLLTTVCVILAADLPLLAQAQRHTAPLVALEALKRAGGGPCREKGREREREP